jgi:predicted Zn-dependent protease
VGCSTRTPVPTGTIPRPIPATAQDEEFGHEAFIALTEKYPLDQDDERRNTVDDIVRKLTSAPKLSQEVWKSYVLIGDSVINAAASRGNYIFVWTGMMKFVQSDDELAAILAHEIAHVLAGHTSPTPEEEAQRVLSQASGKIAYEVMQGAARGGGSSSLYAGLTALAIQQIFNATVVNPESRRQELEADEIGVFLMHQAGYDPRDALTLWSRFSSESGQIPGVLNFLSTHPSSRERLERIEKLIPLLEGESTAKSLPPATTVATSSPTRGKELKQKPAAPIAPAASTSDFEFTPTTRAMRYEVRSANAVIVAMPVFSEQAPLATLSRGETIEVVVGTGPWLGVVAPTTGWIRAADVRSLE